MKERYGEVSIRIDGHVAVIEFNRPPHNHLNVELARNLADALRDIDATPELRCSVLTSAGKTFCAGADLTGSILGDSQSEQDGLAAFYEQAVRLFSTRKPIVAAIQGGAIGAGLGLAMVADFRIAGADARLSANFVKLGFHPGFGLTHTLPRVIGEQRAALMFLTGRRIKPDEALAYGLIEEVVPTEQLLVAAVKLASELAENAPLAVQATRATLRAELAAQVRAHTAKELIEQTALRKTEDFAEGIRAVGERRPGRFTGH
jgi:enoyl-CoA hydratase/carnithine racemase